MRTDVLRLSEASLAWLHAAGATDARPNDLERTYGFPHQLNAARELDEALRVDLDRGKHLRWQLWFYTAPLQEVLEQPLVRRVFAAAPLFGTGAHGRVAHNAAFYVKDCFRRCGLGRAVYACEHDLYKRWGISEIHVSAMRNGLVRWIKSFGFKPADPEGVRARYRTWCRRAGKQPVPPQVAADYPDEFLRSLITLDVYKVLS